MHEGCTYRLHLEHAHELHSSRHPAQMLVLSMPESKNVSVMQNLAKTAQTTALQCVLQPVSSLAPLHSHMGLTFASGSCAMSLRSACLTAERKSPCLRAS